MRNLPTRVLVVLGVVLALLLAGVASRYASGSPDGLERVAEDEGFGDTAERHPAADGPLADYELGDSRDRGVPGIVGALVVLVLASGAVHLVRRRRSEDDEGAPADTVERP